MSIQVEYRNINEVCKSLKVDAVIRPSYVDGPVSIRPARVEDMFQFVISVRIPDNWFDDTVFHEIRKSYTEAIEIAKEQGCRVIASPLLGSSIEECQIEHLLGAALRGIREGIGDGETEVFLALDRNALMRIQKAMPEKLREKSGYKNNYGDLYTNGRKGTFSCLITSRQFNEADYQRIPDRSELPAGLYIDGADRTQTEILAEVFWKYLNKHGFSTPAQVFENLSGVMTDKTCYNIISMNRKGNVTKRNIVAVALAGRLTRNEADDVLAKAGYILTDSLEDRCYKFAFEIDPDERDRIEECDNWLVACHVVPLGDNLRVDKRE